MKICVMANALAVHTERWVRAYAERGHDVHLLSIRHVDIPGVRVHTVRVGPENSTSLVWTLLSYVRLLFAARRRLRHLAPDVLHAHYTVTHGVIAAFSGFRPLVLSAWGTDVIGAYARPACWLLRALNRYAMRRANLLCSTSRFMREKMQLLLKHQQDIILVPYGVDTETFSPSAERVSHNELHEIRIGFVKTLKRKYGPEVLVRAFALIASSIRNVRLIIAGAGPLEKELRQLARDLDIAGRIEFTGRVPHADIAKLMRGLDILVNCTVVPESFGVVILEASACGIPVVATRVGGVPEVCRDGETGLLVEPNDSNALAEAVVRLAKNSELRRSMGQSGRRFVIENYVWQDNVTVMLEHLGRLAEQYQRTA